MSRVAWLVMVGMLVLGVPGSASAQWEFPVVQPMVVAVPSIPLIQTEIWRPVTFGGSVLSYQIDGKDFIVSEGQHWETNEVRCAQSRNRFVEPFDCFGNRVLKYTCIPNGAEMVIQVGWKVHVVRGGKTYFPTWVQTADERIQKVWVGIEPKPAAIETLSEPQSEPQEILTPEPVPVPRKESGPILAPPAPASHFRGPTAFKAGS